MEGISPEAVVSSLESVEEVILQVQVVEGISLEVVVSLLEAVGEASL